MNINELIETLQGFLKEVEEKDKENVLLREKVKILEEDILSMRKVSHIVALERENSSLKEQITKLKAAPPAPSIAVYEKVIKGVTYYIDEKDDSTIYKKNQNESIGEIVGHITRDGGKYRVEWANK